MKYTVKIEMRHCIGRQYKSTTDCPLCCAIREQFPSFGLRSAGGSYVVDGNGVHWPINSCVNTDIKNAWTEDKIFDILIGKLPHFIVEVGYGYPTPVAYPDITSELASKPIRQEVPDIKITEVIMH